MIEQIPLNQEHLEKLNTIISYLELRVKNLENAVHKLER